MRYLYIKQLGTDHIFIYNRVVLMAVCSSGLKIVCHSKLCVWTWGLGVELVRFEVQMVLISTLMVSSSEMLVIVAH